MQAMSAMAKFQNIDVRGRADAAAAVTTVTTVHKNAVSCLTVARGGAGAPVESLCTTGSDGLLVLWDIPALVRQIPSLEIA